MNVSFIGCPCSGKTTTAAMVFAKLKEDGFSAEIVPEYARLYIARKRRQLGLAPGEKLVLTDEDQIKIMDGQVELETTMIKSCGPDVVVVTDTWSLSALLYMSEAARESANVQELLKKHVLPITDLVFYTEPIFTHKFELDPNRVHDEQQALVIDGSIKSVLKTYAPDTLVHPLVGTPDLRSSSVLSKIYSRLLKK